MTSALLPILIFVGTVMVGMQTWVLKEIYALRISVTTVEAQRVDIERRLVALEHGHN